MRESEVVYLLLKKFASKGNFELKHVSVRGLDEKNCYISNGIHKSKTDWKKEVLLLFPDQFQQIIQKNFKGLNECEIFRNKESDKERENDHYDIVLKNEKASGDQRYYYIEAKGDGSDNSYTYIKGQIEKGLGQLILAGRNIKSEDKEERRIKVGDNFCLAFPIEWKDKLCLNLNENKIYDEFCKLFGRKKASKFISLFEFRFFLVGHDEILIVNRDLKSSSILWQQNQQKIPIY